MKPSKKDLKRLDGIKAKVNRGEMAGIDVSIAKEILKETKKNIKARKYEDIYDNMVQCEVELERTFEEYQNTLDKIK